MKHDESAPLISVSQTKRYLIEYCRLANIHDGFNFAMFAIEDFSAKLNPSRILL
jgi:hypothetical protein